MYLKTKFLYLYAISPLHAGAGSSLSAVDLPIQRERVTGFPIIHAGSLKGALKDGVRKKIDQQVLDAVYGPDKPDYASALGVGDAHILLFPVRAIKGVFAWTTSLSALQRWARTVNEAHALPELPSEEPAIQPDAPGCFALDGVVDSSDYVILEDLAFKRVESPKYAAGEPLLPKLAGWIAENCLPADDYWKNSLKNKLVILRDDDFAYFTQHATEVLTRIKLIPDTKTVQPRALWTEEHLPADTLLYAPIHARRLMAPKPDQQSKLENLYVKKDPVKEAANILAEVSKQTGEFLQIGGDETVGCGFVMLKWL